MSWVWIAPGAVAVIGTFLMFLVGARLADQLRGARRDLGRFSELRPALIELRRATGEAGATLQRLRDR